MIRVKKQNREFILSGVGHEVRSGGDCLILPTPAKNTMHTFA